MEHYFEYARQTLLIEKYRLEGHQRKLAEMVAEGYDGSRQDLSLLNQRLGNLEAAIFSLLPEMKLKECQSQASADVVCGSP